MIALRRRLGYRLFSLDDVSTKRPRKDFKFWVRRVAIALPIVLLLNYFVIFQGWPFSSSSTSTSTSDSASGLDHKPARIVNDREKLYGIPFSKKYWCEPVVSLHKTLPEQFHKLWDWEAKWDKEKGPVTYADIMTSFHHLGAFSRRDNWDNADFHGFNFEENDHPSHTSFEACALACHDHGKCIQFTYHGHHCYMSEHLRMGHPKDPDGEHSEKDRRYISGWDMDKIEKWVESMEGYCEGVHWVKPSSKRIF